MSNSVVRVHNLKAVPTARTALEFVQNGITQCISDETSQKPCGLSRALELILGAHQVYLEEMGKFRGKSQPQNLKRFQGSLRDLVSRHSEDLNDRRHFAKPKSTIQSRKERRKEARQLKKLRRKAYHERKPIPTRESLKEEALAREREVKEKKKKEQNKKRKEAQRRKMIEKEEEEEEVKRQELKDAFKEDDKTIKHLAKQLKLNKRKSKTMPQMFINDGLDYLLEVTDAEKLKFMQEGGEEEGEKSKSLKNFHDDSSEEDDMDDFTDEEDESEDEIDSDDLPSDEDVATSEIVSTKPLTEMPKGILKNRKGKGSDKKTVAFDDVEKSTDEDEEEEEDEEEDDEEEEVIRRGSKLCKSKNSSKEKLSLPLEEDDSDVDDVDFDEDEEDGMELEDGDDAEGDVTDEDGDEEEEDSKGSDSEEKEEELKEDIYGRLRDKHGNVVAPGTGAYVPPAKRLQAAQGEDAKQRLLVERTKRQIKGLINRLSEANLYATSNQIEAMYRHSSRAVLTECLADTILEACTGGATLPERLIMELCALVSVLHSTVGNEVGATFLQSIVKLFDAHFKRGGNYGDNKEMDNIVLLLAHLCNFRVVHSLLIFDIFKKFVSVFRDRDVQLILLLLRAVGFTIRKDDPTALKDIILEIQAKASSTETSQFVDQSRVKFMLEILMAVKNNNMGKIPSYDPEPIEQLKKTLKTVLKGSASTESQLRISLDDLLQADNRGRWWMVGSAWTGKDDERKTEGDNMRELPGIGDVSAEILELARKQRMNTDVRRNIFCVLMMAEDYADAFEKLLRLGLKQTQEREIIHVILDTSLQEKTYNPYYSHLLLKFCEYHKRFKMTVQFTLWDKFKELEEKSDTNISNLAAVLSFLIRTKAMSLAVFKVIEFADLDKCRVRFIKQVLQSLLLEPPEEDTKEVFTRVARLQNLSVMREGLKLFMRHFMLRKALPGVDMSLLRTRIAMAVKCLSGGDSAYAL